MHVIQGLFLSLGLLAPSAGASDKLPHSPKIICKEALSRLAFGSPGRRMMPIQSFKIPGLKIEGVADGDAWLHRYADNLWGISGENDPLDRIAQSLLLGGNPTPHRSDVLYIFAHGFKEFPFFGTQTKGGALIMPSTLLEQIKEFGHDPVSRMRAVVLLSCHSGSLSGKADPNFLSTSAYVSAITGLPVIAPTGALVLQLSDRAKGYTIEGFYQDRVDPGTTGWSIITAAQPDVPSRSDVLSLEEMREISGFYKRWEAHTREELPNHLEADQIEHASDKDGER